MTALLAIAVAGCQTRIVDRARETTSDVVSGIRNLPSTVLPNQFESVAIIDNDFSIRDARIAPDGEHAVIRNFFATNRSTTGSEEPYLAFNDIRSDLSYGKSYVVVRRQGNSFDVEPESLSKVQLGEPPEEDRSLLHNELLDQDDFISDLNTAISRADDNRLLLYVHGYNISFEEAANRSAQLNYDLGFSGTAVFFSWPSRGEQSTYVVDVETSVASQRHFEKLINSLLSASTASKIDLVAHGLGARLSARVLQSVFLTQPVLRNRIGEIVLVAPDIEKGEFTEELAPALGTAQSPVTLYAAANASELSLSRSLSTFGLAGDSSDGLLITQRVETIDAGSSETSFSNHAAFDDTETILPDLWDLIQNGLRANSRPALTARYTTEGTYWQYPRQR